MIQAGYVCFGAPGRVITTPRLYTGADGVAVLALPRLASGNSMFRRAFWEQAPYREDLLGAWDTALWLGFAHCGARFRPTTRAIFQYRQHADSVFHRRQRTPVVRDQVTRALKQIRRGEGRIL